MDVPANEATVMEMLDTFSDNGLRAVIGHSQSLLEARETERLKQATSEIQRLAKQSGLIVSVKQPGRRRGRPPKEKGASS